MSFTLKMGYYSKENNTVCPRSLDRFFIVTNTFRTYSILQFVHSEPFHVSWSALITGAKYAPARVHGFQIRWLIRNRCARTRG